MSQAEERALRYELVVMGGLEALALAEVERRLTPPAEVKRRLRPPAVSIVGPGRLEVVDAGGPDRLLRLRLVHSLYRLTRWSISRPRALLGDATWRQLNEQIGQIIALAPGQYQSCQVSAAGADSVVLRRLRQQLAVATGLVDSPAGGDLLLRLRRPPDGSAGWESLVRLTPRPLATRAWRLCHWPGALNASLAAAMVELSQPAADDRVLNIGCGSATLLIERLAVAPARLALGCDLAPAALACAAVNLAAAGLSRRVSCAPWDAGRLPLADGTIDVILADLPFGQLIGSHAENERLYPALLSEAARVTRPGGRAVLITHERRLLARTLAVLPAWAIEREIALVHEDRHPRIVCLRRRSGG